MPIRPLNLQSDLKLGSDRHIEQLARQPGAYFGRDCIATLLRAILRQFEGTLLKMSPSKPDRMKPILDCVQRKLGTNQGKGNALYTIVCSAIPANLRDSIVFTRLKNRRLHITTASGAAANRLRFCQRALLEACAVLPEGPEYISIRVAPAGTVKLGPEPKQRYTKREKPLMGVQASTNLQQAADGIDHKPLREALKRLASRGNAGSPFKN